MARKGSPVIGDNGITATAGELNTYTAHVKQQFIKSMERGAINLHDADQVQSAIIEYFEDCEAAGIRPGNLGMYAALGLSRQDVSNILTGKSRSRVSLETIDTIKKACLFLGEYREILAASGKLNPITSIFWQKNFDGLTDTSSLVLEAVTSRSDANMTPEQVAAEIEKDIPIDTPQIAEVVEP